ncbi:MAG: hypothetical protein ACNA7K_01220 [Acholeplasmataceae bacterium]|jgi:NADH:ubiquinone oxidoreductase subunit 2 (subunit N)
MQDLLPFLIVIATVIIATGLSVFLSKFHKKTAYVPSLVFLVLAITLFFVGQSDVGFSGLAGILFGLFFMICAILTLIFTSILLKRKTKRKTE